MPAVSESKCFTCGQPNAKYRCPGCLNASCSLSCVNDHKLKIACTGKRPVNHFVPYTEYNQSDLLSDYRFLEQVERSLYGKKNNRIVHSNQMYPVVVDYLRRGAFKRGIKLKFLSLGMGKRSTNSSMFNRRTDTLTWKVDWEFPLSMSQAVYSDKSVDDKTVIETALNKYLSTDETTPDVIRQCLKKYIVNMNDVVVLMSNSLCGDKKRYYIVDTKLTLRQFLLGKTIVEYPTFTVTLKSFLDRYKLIEKEEEVGLATEMKEKRLSRFYSQSNYKAVESSTNTVSSETTIVTASMTGCTDDIDIDQSEEGMDQQHNVDQSQTRCTQLINNDQSETSCVEPYNTDQSEKRCPQPIAIDQSKTRCDQLHQINQFKTSTRGPYTSCLETTVITNSHIHSVPNTLHPPTNANETKTCETDEKFVEKKESVESDHEDNQSCTRHFISTSAI